MANEPKDPAKGAPKDDPKAEGNEPKRSGRVAFDARGNSVWEWQLETGVYSRDVNTQKLKKLDLGDLSIAETATHKRPPGLGSEEQRPGGGFNPYDSAPNRPNAANNPYDKARSQPKVPSPTPPKPAAAQPQRSPPRTPDQLRRLSEWIKLKKKVESDKDDD